MLAIDNRDGAYVQVSTVLVSNRDDAEASDDGDTTDSDFESTHDFGNINQSIVLGMPLKS